MSKAELKKYVYKIVDDWLELGDVEDQHSEDIAGFEEWAVKKVKAGDELSSFAEQVIDELLGQFKGTDDSVHQALKEERAEAWDEGKTAGHSIAMRRMSDEPQAPTPHNPYRKQEEA